MEKLGSSLAFLLKVVFQSLVYTTCWCPSSISRRLQMLRRTLCPLAALCPTEDRKVSGGSAVAPGAADTPSSGSPPPRPERVHNRQPRVRGVLLRCVLLCALHRHAAGLHQDLHRPPQASQAGQHEAEQPGFQGQPEGPAQGPQTPPPLQGPPPTITQGLAHAQQGAGDTGTP